MSHPRKSKFVLAILFIVSIAAGCGAPAAQPTTVPPTSSSVVLTQPPTSIQPTLPPTAVEPAKVSIESVKFNSEALKGNLLGDPAERPLQVLLPPGYATSTKRYPVIYYLHGYGLDADASTPMLDGYRDWFLHAYSAKGTYGDFVADLEKAMRSNVIQEMILVFPNSENKLGGSGYLNSPVIGDHEKYLTQEIVSYIDSHYRTLPTRESRGITGCSMGGDGAAHLGMKYPNVYAVAVAQSGLYYWDKDPYLLLGLNGFTKVPASVNEILAMNGYVISAMATAAGAAPNVNKPPLYFDMPYVIDSGAPKVDPNFVDKLKAIDPVADVEQYLKQPIRLNALLVQHAATDPETPVGLARDFDKLLTAKGIAHEFDDSFITHCAYDEFPPMLKFMSDHLVAEKMN